MSIDIRAVLTSYALDAPGTGSATSSAIAWTADTAVSQIARAQEAWGFDSTLIAAPPTASDPAVLSSFALAATSRITVAGIHRVGVQQPTHAARAFATRSLLSGGRAQVLLMTDESSQRDLADGDTLTGSSRQRRALEYAELFRRELESREPFDYDGEFYTVRDAFSGIKPPTVSGTIAATGLTDYEVELAARFADVYALPSVSIGRTEEIIGAVTARAGEYGRTLRFWRQGNAIVAETDAAARERAERIGQREEALVGSVDTVADLILEYYRRGVTTVTLGGLHGASSEHRTLLSALVQEIRRRVDLLGAAPLAA